MSSLTRTFDQHPPDKDFGPTVLIVDDDALSVNRLKDICESTKDASSLRLLIATNLKEAVEILAANPVHVVLLDKDLRPSSATPLEEVPTENGIEFIPQILELAPSAQILVVTSSREVEDCVHAMKLGAFGYITKENPDSVIFSQIEKAIQVSTLTLMKIRSERGLHIPDQRTRLVGTSVAVEQLRSQLLAVAETNRPILLTGETGVGKTTCAKLIHDHRKEFLKQSDRPFLELNIGAIPPTLAERELFGNERGSYTGATDARPGYFELANNGTLFLDEIGEATPELQVKLLKVIDEGKFYRIGGSKERHSSFKLICATNRNLEQMVTQGLFREDLYMRISTFVVRVPSLEERKEDVPEIVRSILPRSCKENNVYVSYEDLPKDFIEYLSSGSIRGNIRGIERELSRILVYAPKDIHNFPQLKNWRLGFGYPRSLVSRGGEKPLTMNEIRSRPFKVTEEFPGLKGALAEIQEKIVTDTVEQSPTKMAAAKLLKVANSTISFHTTRQHRQAASARPKSAQLFRPRDARAEASV